MVVDAELEELRKARMVKLMNTTTENTEKPAGVTVPVTDASFEQFVADNKLVLVDAWAPWCGPCRMVGPVLDQIAAEQAGNVTIGKLNVDENRAVSMKFKIMSIPTMLVFKDGTLVDSMVGALPKPQIEAVLKKHMN